MQTPQTRPRRARLTVTLNASKIKFAVRKKEKYQAFKTVVKSIGEERRLGKDFELISGYSLYHTVKFAKENKKALLKMKG